MTGTGNTARAAGLIAEVLTRAGWTTTSAELRVGEALSDAARAADLLILCFPVLGFGIPALVRKLLKGLRGRGQPAAAFATWGGDGSIALWQARLFLRRKGFRVVATGGATYPLQWTQVMAPPTGEGARHVTDSGDEECIGFARRLTARPDSGRPFHPRIAARNIIPLVLGPPVAFLYSWIGRFGLGAMYAADERCKACGNCERDCPSRAIVMKGDGARRRPRWTASCQGCNRCINLCPRAAVQVSPLRVGVHLVVNAAVIVAIVVGLNRLAEAAALPAPVSVPAYIAALIALAVIGSRVQFAALEPVLFALEGLPSVRGTIRHSWTARFPRYRCEGFRPTHRRGGEASSGNTN